MNNQLVIHGRIGKEPELRYTNNQMAVLELSVVDTYGKKGQNEKSTWHNVIIFGQLAENTSRTLSKGDMILVVGRIEQDEYTKKDGTKGKSVKVIADEIGASVRWTAWVKDNTDAVMAQVGKVFPSARVVSDDEMF